MRLKLREARNPFECTEIRPVIAEEIYRPALRRTCVQKVIFAPCGIANKKMQTARAADDYADVSGYVPRQGDHEDRAIREDIESSPENRFTRRMCLKILRPNRPGSGVEVRWQQTGKKAVLEAPPAR